MKQIIIFGIIIVFIFLAAYITRILQQRLQPRASAKRLLLYVTISLLVIMLLTFSMVLIIIRLFPGELIK